MRSMHKDATVATVRGANVARPTHLRMVRWLKASDWASLKTDDTDSAILALPVNPPPTPK